MRKLLFLVLIAIAVCSVVEIKDDVSDLDAVSWSKIWKKAKSVLSKAKNFLKQTGIWAVIKKALGEQGAEYAGKICESLGIPGDVCSSMVKIVAGKM